jgi:hypothetical protein
MLDAPCGDFYWMKQVDLSDLDYIGADIVMDLIRQNRRYQASNVRFRKLNLIDDRLPKVDLIFCRDCLVHLCFKDLFMALHNICRSGSTYLLTTTFKNPVHNDDIETGQWRPINLEIPPFSFPAPLRLINEGCTEADGIFADKSLGLWQIQDIATCLGKRD